jgi:hypothetical protein
MPGRKKYLSALEEVRGKSYDKQALTKADSVLSTIPEPDKTEQGLKTQIGRRLDAHKRQEDKLRKKNNKKPKK